MGKYSPHMNRGDYLKPTAVALLGEPLEFIHEDHLRARQICITIDDIALGDAPDSAKVARTLGFLTHELPLHLQDKEEDLFPLLRRRCEAEDEIGKVISKLHKDHAHADEDTPQIVALLGELVERPRPLSQAERAALAAYTVHARRHLILENAIILPFARLRLTETDLETLYIRMCQRRGIESLREIIHAQ